MLFHCFSCVHFQGSIYVSINIVDSDPIVFEHIATLSKTFTLIPGAAAVKATLVGNAVT